MLDPRLMLLVPRDMRPAMMALSQLDARLFGVVAQRREDVLAQLKLAWWRDRLEQLAKDPAALPRGEPLLGDLIQHWGHTDDLAGMADGYEAAMLAATIDEAHAASEILATSMMRGLMRLGQSPLPLTWAKVRVAQMVSSRELAQRLWHAAATTNENGPSPRAVRTLSRWARLVAVHQGSPSGRAEGWFLLRAGIGF